MLRKSICLIMVVCNSPPIRLSNSSFLSLFINAGQTIHLDIFSLRGC